VIKISDHSPITMAVTSLRQAAAVLVDPMHFEALAAKYARERPAYPPALDRLRELGLLQSGHPVLDLGVGTGQATGPLSPKAPSVVPTQMKVTVNATSRTNSGGPYVPRTASRSPIQARATSSRATRSAKHGSSSLMQR
jgi:hypothetical protein